MVWQVPALAAALRKPCCRGARTRPRLSERQPGTKSSRGDRLGSVCVWVRPGSSSAFQSLPSGLRRRLGRQVAAQLGIVHGQHSFVARFGAFGAAGRLESVRLGLQVGGRAECWSNLQPQEGRVARILSCLLAHSIVIPMVSFAITRRKAAVGPAGIGLFVHAALGLSGWYSWKLMGAATIASHRARAASRKGAGRARAEPACALRHIGRS